MTSFVVRHHHHHHHPSCQSSKSTNMISNPVVQFVLNCHKLNYIPKVKQAPLSMKRIIVSQLESVEAKELDKPPCNDIDELKILEPEPMPYWLGPVRLPIQLVCVTFWLITIICGHLMSFYVCYTSIHFLLTSTRTIADHFTGQTPFRIRLDPYTIYQGVKFKLISYLVYRYAKHYLADWGVERRGGRFNRWLRDLALWRYAASYFPIRLAASRELLAYAKRHQRPLNDLLPPNQNYLLGYHPHGIASAGAAYNFLTNTTRGCEEMFASLLPRQVTLNGFFRIPLLRESLINMGAISAAESSIKFVLESKPSNNKANLVVVVPGGSREMLNSYPGSYRLILQSRTGFFRMALETGSSLIPCMSFGETGLWNQIGTDDSSWVRKFQEFLLKISTKTAPFIYAWGWIPYRYPIYTVVGAPIEVEKPSDTSPVTIEQITQLKQQYIDQLRHLFDTYKHRFDPLAKELVIC